MLSALVLSNENQTCRGREAPATLGGGGCHIRERIERNGASSAPAAPIQRGAVPTIKLPICPACGGKVTIRTGKDGKLKLECINYYEKGRTCPNKYNIEDYIKITY